MSNLDDRYSSRKWHRDLSARPWSSEPARKQQPLPDGWPSRSPDALKLPSMLKLHAHSIAGATMAPLLLSDFERIYEASADALRVAGPGDHGVALHRRWPDKRYRLFARDGDRFDFVGNSARRPGADQLRAIYAETTRHRVYDGS